jgi:hypothetical protein
MHFSLQSGNFAITEEEVVRFRLNELHERMKTKVKNPLVDVDDDADDNDDIDYDDEEGDVTSDEDDEELETTAAAEAEGAEGAEEIEVEEPHRALFIVKTDTDMSLGTVMDAVEGASRRSMWCLSCCFLLFQTPSLRGA